MPIIYKPLGPAGEYAELAMNIYTGCTHGCRYCYAPSVVRKSKKQYFRAASPKKDVIRRLDKDCRALLEKGDCPEILLSFIGDPYQPAEKDLKLTRQAIRTLKRFDLPFTILTKGAGLAVRDFGLLQGYPRCSFGVSLSFYTDTFRQFWEPRAASVKDRFRALRLAHDLGIRTWVSLEPVIIPGEAWMLVGLLHDVVDHWKVGKINHHPQIESGVDWIAFRDRIIDTLESHGTDYYIKESLSKL